MPSVLSVAHFAVKDYHEQNKRNAVGANHWQIVFGDAVEQPEHHAGIHGKCPQQAYVSSLAGSDDSESLWKKRQGGYDSGCIAKVLGFKHDDQFENSRITGRKIKKAGESPRLFIIIKRRRAYLLCSTM
jgi:hypothetical protein